MYSWWPLEPQTTISKELLFLKSPLLILDLSIPKNVDSNVVENPLVSLVHLDELSKMLTKPCTTEKQGVPLALAILGGSQRRISRIGLLTENMLPLLDPLKKRKAE